MVLGWRIKTDPVGFGQRFSLHGSSGVSVAGALSRHASMGGDVWSADAARPFREQLFLYARRQRLHLHADRDRGLMWSSVPSVGTH